MIGLTGDNIKQFKNAQGLMMVELGNLNLIHKKKPYNNAKSS